MLALMLVVALVLSCAALACAATDAWTGRIPNAITLPAIGLVVVTGVVEPLVLLAGVLCASVYAVAFALRTCGGGDVKLAAVVGGALGAPAAAVATVVVAASVTLVVSLVSRRRAVVHGPALVAAAGLVTAFSIAAGP
ncbi:prepilin peptidase [Gordonia sp. HY285]|uniref:prepilin peptidase n=1 Tax=Gordonia liuliyuniae TaxID=2911517 RepID=UPI001F02EE8E|nr:prepilin peptidase [Gordonia liuliyuniae]MCF8610711.1 prepilin peptidase [Gordonia liuliyuniae]